MPSRKIVFCGAPLAGKTTLLLAISEMTGSKRIQTMLGKTEHITALEVALDEESIVCVTISGVFFNPEQNGVLNKLLRKADMVVYVCDTVPPINAEPFYFHLYSREAARLLVSWNEIPWMFVLNKVDRSNDNPLRRFIPSQFHDQIVKCVANRGENVREIWQQIVSKVS